ncbi:glycosyltransferase family 2 protein [Neptuniibacter sp. QD29_5]|uniref:glycosyltransferase family 2 protein n=1 Tax=Neptuniibacter sp. QD29_5 TaxID=3398207 RepID=UPI0039F5B1AE
MALVSIITPVYNSSDFILDSIKSVVNQTVEDWELILVDDCSSDSTAQIIKNYALTDSRVKFFQLEKNSGAAVARNFAINEARGRYIAFLDSDDLWHEEKLSKQLSFMQDNQVAFTYSSYQQIDEEGNSLSEISVPSKVGYKQLLKTNVIGCLTVIYDTEMIGKHEMPLIRKRQDFGLWLKLLKTVDYAYGIKEPLAFYRVRKGSISSNKLSAAKFTWDLYRKIECLPLHKALYYFSCYAIGGIAKSCFLKT